MNGKGQSSLPFWARIESSGVQGGVLMYSWTEMQPISLGTFTEMVAGRSGGLTGCPAVEPNCAFVTSGAVVLMIRGYYDRTYDWVYYIVAGASVLTTCGGDGSGSGSEVTRYYCGTYDETSAGDCGAGLPAESCAAAEAADPMVLGVTYGPFALPAFGEHWFRFPTVQNENYHVTLTWVEGSSIAASTYIDCGLAFWFGTGEVSSSNTTECGDSVIGAAATGFAILQVTAPSGGIYLVKINSGPCP